MDPVQALALPYPARDGARPDALLSARLMPADSSLVADLYRRHAPAVYRRALGLLKDPEEANDVVQEVFLGYLKQEWRGEAAPFTVLYQLATFQSIDRLRKRSRWSGVLGPLEAPADQDDDGAPATIEGVTEDGSARLEAAQDLALLTAGEEPRTLTAAVLYWVDGCTTQEVAEVLDLSRKTVGKLLARFTERARSRTGRVAAGGRS